MKISETVSASDHPIFLHCATGGRATLAAEQLVRMGYTEVTVITCPIDVICETQGG
jgi:rhodanese-related sulfurtransferase